jgi:K+-transporting ATPase KdpF subunit
MSIVEIFALGLAVGFAIYLVLALLYPENFQ